MILLMKFVDLFSGMGSFHYSFKKLGYQCVAASDINKTTRKTYITNYGIEPSGDIVKIKPQDIPPHNILCAGFPCQPFSQCGRGMGFEDQRGTMFHQVMKFVKHHEPDYVILENVKALLNHDNGNTFKIIKTELEKQGYHVIHKILVCSDYGIPQMRKRLFIIAHRGNLSDSFFAGLKKYEKKVTLSKFFDRKFQKETAYTLRCGGRSSPINDRHNWDGYIVDGKEYRLSIEDGLKLQGFESFVLEGTETQKWKQLGNTIPTIFTDIIGKEIAAAVAKGSI